MNNSSIQISNVHPKLMDVINDFTINPRLKCEFWGEFSLFINFRASKSIRTAGVWFDFRGAQYYYNSTFFDGLNDKQIRYVHIHEIMHLLSNHPQRIGARNKEIANIAMDMVINSDIKDHMWSLVEEPPFKPWYIPEEYDGPRIFEAVYEWLLENNDQLSGSQQLVDTHFDHKVDDALREEMVKSALDVIRQRGFVTNDIEEVLKKIRPKKKDYLRQIKRQISMVRGYSKVPSIRKPNRRGISGLKGKHKIGHKINVVLDVSGSMDGHFEDILSYVFQNDLKMNLVQCDTEIKAELSIDNKAKLNKMKIQGLGGTTLQPALEYLKNNYAKINTVVLTDGYTDKLDFTGLGRKNLVISCGVAPEVEKANIIVINNG